MAQGEIDGFQPAVKGCRQGLLLNAVDLQSADSNGRFCGAKRTRCGASGLIYALSDLSDALFELTTSPEDIDDDNDL